MAIYNNFSDVKDNAEFLDFIQKEFGIANLSQIADYEQTALLMSFKSHTDDLGDADKEFLEEIRQANNKEDMEALTATELSTIRSFDQLSPAQQIYISVKNYDAKEKGVSLEQITNDLQKRSLTNIREQYELANIEFYDFLRNTTLRHRSDELDKLAQEKYGMAFNELGTDDMQAVIRQELEAERFDINKLRNVYDNMTPERRAEVIARMQKLEENIDYVAWLAGEYDNVENAENTLNVGVISPATEQKEKEETLNVSVIYPATEQKEKEETLNVSVIPHQQPENENKQSVDTLTDNDNNHGGNDNGNNKQDEFIVQDARVFEDNSDKNEAKFDRLKYNILLEMGKINPQLSAEELRDQSKVYTAAQNAIASLSDKDSHEFNALFADEIVRTANNEQMMKVVPPTILTQVYNYYGEEIAKAKGDEVDDLIKRQDIIAARMDRLTDEYYTGIRNIVRDNFNYDDRVNIADIYEGYKEMLAARRPYASEPQQAKIDAVDKKLKMDIADYDTDRGIADITKDNINQVRKNHQELTKRFENIGLDDETNKFLSNIRFYDEKGQVVPQFINPQTNQESLTWQQGMYVKPNSQLQTMIDFARNNTIIENMSADVKSISDEDLQAAFQDRLKIQAFAWATAEENVHNALIEPDRFTDEKYLNEFKARMADPERPLHMSIRGFNAATQLSINDTMGIIGRLASEDHIDNPKDALLKRMYAPIEKYDARKGTRFDEKGEYSVNWFKTAVWTAGASLAQKLLTYGATLGCAHAASALGLTALAPAVAVTKALPMVAGVTSMAMAGVGMYMNWKNYKKEAKANNQKPKLREFLTKQPYATTNIASTLGFAAGACLITGNVPVAAALGAGCLAVAGYGTYKEARQHGLTKRKALLQSLKKVSAIAVGGGLGSYIGSMIGVTPAWQEKGPDTPGHVEQGPDSHNYSNIEHQHATNRLDDPRFSEFLNRFHVAPDLQDPSDPNVVSSDAVTNLRSAITQAIGDDRQFYTDIANNPQNPDYIPNTDVLSYKFEQLAYLAPKPDTPINTDYAVNVLHVPVGTTVGEYLSMKMPDGSDMNYIDALKEVVSTGKSSNPDGLASMLTKIDNVIGMQIDDNVNDAGKITLFGTGPEAHPVQSFNENADAGYDIGKHFTMVAGKVGEVINHGGEKLFGLGYWEPVKGAFSGMKKRIGAIADKIIGVKTSQTPPPVQTPPTDKTPPVQTPPTDKTPPVDKTPPKVIIKVPTPEERKYLDEEYWMVHGYNPAEKKVRGEDGKMKTLTVNPMTFDAGYKAYYENVEKERVAAGGKPMLEFLQERRRKIDKIINDNVSNFNGSYAQRSNADILDPIGYKQVLQKQAELKNAGKSMTKEEIDKAILWPTSQELKDEYKTHRPTSKLIKIIRDAFFRKDNEVDVTNPNQRTTTVIDGKTVEANKKVFSFEKFIDSAEDALVRTTSETSRDENKASKRRTLDEMGNMKKLNNR